MPYHLPNNLCLGRSGACRGPPLGGSFFCGSSKAVGEWGPEAQSSANNVAGFGLPHFRPSSARPNPVISLRDPLGLWADVSDPSPPWSTAKGSSTEPAVQRQPRGVAAGRAERLGPREAYGVQPQSVLAEHRAADRKEAIAPDAGRLRAIDRLPRAGRSDLVRVATRIQAPERVWGGGSAHRHIFSGVAHRKRRGVSSGNSSARPICCGWVWCFGALWVRSGRSKESSLYGGVRNIRPREAGLCASKVPLLTRVLSWTARWPFPGRRRGSCSPGAPISAAHGRRARAPAPGSAGPQGLHGPRRLVSTTP